MAGHTIIQNRGHSLLAQVHRIRICHAPWPPVPSQHFEIKNQPGGSLFESAERHTALEELIGFLNLTRYFSTASQ
jgi:hypothetical protein